MEKDGKEEGVKTVAGNPWGNSRTLLPRGGYSAFVSRQVPTCKMYMYVHGLQAAELLRVHIYMYFFLQRL